MLVSCLSLAFQGLFLSQLRLSVEVEMSREHASVALAADGNVTWLGGCHSLPELQWHRLPSTLRGLPPAALPTLCPLCFWLEKTEKEATLHLTPCGNRHPVAVGPHASGRSLCEHGFGAGFGGGDGWWRLRLFGAEGSENSPLSRAYKSLWCCALDRAERWFWGTAPVASLPSPRMLSQHEERDVRGLETSNSGPWCPLHGVWPTCCAGGDMGDACAGF